MKGKIENNSLSLKCFLNTLKESSENGKRYCFILGSGVSRNAGIPTGIDLSKIWVKEIKEKYNEKEIEILMEQLEIKDISIKSENYFDIYKLRFFPDYRNGYSYLERKMENAQPGFGHYPLARFLATTENNLVITTNFDSLIEDALFIYTGKRPIVASHESLAEYVDISTKRPIIAKLHRGLFFHPLNKSDELKELSEQWTVFRIFTPIVIGYGGGDRTLMEFLKDRTVELNGIYWCYVGAEPNEDILKLVEDQKGYFVPIAGFDEMMLMLGNLFHYESPNQRIMEVAKERAERYDKEFDEFSRKVEEITEPTKAEKVVKKSLEDYADKEKAALLELIKKEPSVENYYRLGNYERINGNYSDAVEYYTKAIELNPDYEAAYNCRGIAYWGLKNYKDSIKDYSKCIELDSQNYITYYNQGISYDDLSKIEEKKENLKKAIENYSKSIELNPEYADVYNNRGNSYSDLGEKRKAIEDYNKAIELNPEYAIAYNNRGNRYSELGEKGKAIEDYNKAIELNPEYAMAYNNRGNSYSDLGEKRKAIEDYNKAIELNPEYTDAYNNRGNRYGDLGETGKAIEDYNKAIELNPEYVMAYNNRGNRYSDLGEEEKAIGDYNKAIELNPEYALAYYNRGICYKKLGETKKAEKDFQKAAELDLKYKK